MAERRAHPRHRTLKAGKIVFNHRFCVVDCTVRNLSADGACLQVPSTLGIPDDFDLLIEPEKATHTCRVAWKNETRMGVTFQ
jgi:PilZ domain